jgi:hypothetical protein
MLGKNGIFRGKSFEKLFFRKNSAEFSAENNVQKIGSRFLNTDPGVAN